MNYKFQNLKIFRIAFYFLLVIFYSCEQLNTPSEELISAPSRNLPAAEIMQVQGINSIHFIKYDSVIVNGNSYDHFVPSVEFDIESDRIKMNQYYLGTPDWNITVYDFKKDSVWHYYSGQLTFSQIPDLRFTIDSYVQSNLGSSLKGPINFLRTEYVGDKLCNVFSDSTGYTEWVWIQYRLPIQYRVESNNDVHQIGVVQKRNIEINLEFSDVLFEPPNN
jgi:hypothetical protein